MSLVKRSGSNLDMFRSQLMGMFDEMEREFFGMPMAIAKPGSLANGGGGGGGGSAMMGIGMRMDFKTSEDGKNYVLHAELPGVPKEDLKIEVTEQNMLQISAETEKGTEDKTDTYHIQERSYGKLFRQISLPDDAVWDKASAEHKNGLLTVTMPREVKAAKKMSIAIN